MEIKINVANEMRKLRDTAYSDRTAWVEELVQNAQRARAKHVYMVLGYDSIIFEDDGIGCTDPAVLFEKSSSGWDSSVASQNPFGEGFFSVMMVADLITVESVGFKAVFDVLEILERGNVDCVKITSNRSRKKGMKVTLSQLRPDYYVGDVMEKFKEVTQYISGIRFILHSPDGQTVQVQRRKFTEGNGNKFTVVIQDDDMQGWLSPFIWGKDGYSGDMIKVFAQERFVKDIYWSGLTGIIHVDDGVLDLRSPDRKDIINNWKYQDFRDAIRSLRKGIYLDIVVNGSDDDIDKYEKNISNHLEVEEYAHHMKFIYSKDEGARKQYMEEEGGGERESVEFRDSIGAEPICIIDGDIKIKSPIVPPGFQHQVDIPDRTGREADDRAFYVKNSEISEPDLLNKVKVAEYYDIPVIITRNTLEEKTLDMWGFQHISKLSEVVDIEVEVHNPGPQDPEEQRAVYLFDFISKLCGMDHNIFTVGEVSAWRITKIHNHEVEREKVCILAVACGESIYVDRDELSPFRFHTDGRVDNPALMDSDREFIIKNMEVIAHELAHVIYGTLDNTQSHAEAQIVITNQILRGLY